MNIVAKETGILSVAGRGRVGSYESAVRGRRSRPRSYWVIEEELWKVKFDSGIENGMIWESRTKHTDRDDLGEFKTKSAAIKFLSDYAAEHGLSLNGNIHGYPWICIPASKT